MAAVDLLKFASSVKRIMREAVRKMRTVEPEVAPTENPGRFATIDPMILPTVCRGCSIEVLSPAARLIGFCRSCRSREKGPREASRPVYKF